MSITQAGIRPVFSHDVFAFQKIGGVSRYVCDLHVALRRLGVRSTVFAPLHVNRLLAKTRPALGMYLPESAQRIRGTRRIMRTVDRVAEPLVLDMLAGRGRRVVHHKTYYSSVPPSRKYATVVTVHDMIHERHSELFSPNDTTRANKRLWCERADAVIAISDYTKRELVRLLGIDPDRIAVCHHGTRRVEPDPARREALAGSRAFFLYVGKRDGYKNFHQLIAAFSQSHAAREGMRLIAFGEDEPTPEELAFLDAHGVRQSVSFVGGDDATLAAYYSTARGMLYPSLDEGFGLPPLEAMGHGCPVAASNAGAIPEVAADAALLFDPLLPEAMAAAIDRLATDEELRAQLVPRGIARAAAFTWEASARCTLAAYAAALDAAARRS